MMPRSFRWVGSALMVIGGVPFVLAGLALLRDWLGRHGMNVIPNVDARPQALLAGAAVFLVGALLRRSLLRRGDGSSATTRERVP